MDRDEFRSARKTWFNHLVDKALTPQVLRIVESDTTASRLDPPALALLLIHAGLGHLLGYEDDEQSVEGALPAAVVTDFVSRVWRGGEVDATLVMHLPHTWITLYCVGRDTEALGVDFLETILTSAVGRWVQSMTDWDLTPTLINSEFEDAAVKLPQLDQQQRLDMFGPTSDLLDCEGSHIWTVQALFALERLTIGSTTTTALELLAAYSDTDDDAAKVEDLRLARRVQLVSRSMPGSWPSTATGHVPEWLQQVVLQIGARYWDGTTGLVPSWALVMESEEEARSLRGWLYQPGIAVAKDLAEDSTTLGIPLHFPTGEVGYAWFRYPHSDLLSQIHLRTLLAVGFLRVDVYRLTTGSELLFEWSAGFPIPEELVDQIADTLPAIAPDAAFSPSAASGEESLQIMAIRDEHNFELVKRCQSAYRVDPAGELAISYRDFLDATHAAASAQSRGSIIDSERIDESYEALRAEMSRAPSSPIPLPLDPRVLGPERVYLQFRTTVGDQFLEAFSAYCRSDGTVVDARWDLSTSVSFRNLSPDPSTCVRQLGEGLGELSQLLAEGVRHAVVNLDQATYALPIHQALITIGFEEVSYAHSLSSLRPLDSTSPTKTVVVEGWPGEGNKHVRVVETELAAVRSLYPAPDVSSGEKPADVLHLSGHAQTGTDYADVYIASSSTSVVSSASTLRDFDGAAELVVLAACGTGVVDFGSGRLLATPPLDVAFIEAGAKAVVSTSAPVNDTIAGLFSCVFHYAHSRGSDIWPAFSLATAAARGEGQPDEIAEWLATVWPSWSTDREVALRKADADWMLFRVSGHHWADVGNKETQSTRW